MTNRFRERPGIGCPIPPGISASFGRSRADPSVSDLSGTLTAPRSDPIPARKRLDTPIRFDFRDPP